MKQALEAGHTVTAFVRNPDKLTVKDDKLTIESINIFDKEVGLVFLNSKATLYVFSSEATV